jgi:hypothetical protein
MRTTLLTLMLVAGCKGGATSKPSEGSATPTGSAGSAAPKAPASTLNVTKDGAAVPVEHAFVKQLPDGKLQLYVGEGGSCEQLLTNVFDGKNASLLIDLPSRLAADGTESFAVGDIYDGPSEAADPGAKVTVKGALTKGNKVAIDLDFTSKAMKVEVKGSVTAESCGEQDTSTGPLPKAQHASTATMTIANKSLPIRAALVRGKAVELSDFPRDCTSAWFIGAKLEHDTDWKLSGQRFAQEVSGPGEGLTTTLGARGTSDDGPTVQITVGGTGNVGDYPVKLDGTIEALDCK